MLLFAALYVRMIRAGVMETLNEDYVRTSTRGSGCRCKVEAEVAFALF